jgi:sterol O-acyltransferase
MCALTAVTWIIQRLVSANYINWDGAGWVIQNVSYNCHTRAWEESSWIFSDVANGLSGWRSWPDSLA